MYTVQSNKVGWFLSCDQSKGEIKAKMKYNSFLIFLVVYFFKALQKYNSTG